MWLRREGEAGEAPAEPRLSKELGLALSVANVGGIRHRGLKLPKLDDFG